MRFPHPLPSPTRFPRLFVWVIAVPALLSNGPNRLTAATLTQLSQWPETLAPSLEPTAIHLDGDHLWVGLEDGLTVLDVSQPDRPARLGTVGFDNSPPEDIYVADGRAYTSSGPGEIRVIDVADSLQPSLLTTLIPSYWVESVYARSNYLYTSHNGWGLGLTSLSNLSTAHFGVRRTAIKASGRLEVVDQIAYVPTLTGLEIHRYDTTTDFTLLGHYDTGGLVGAVEVVGDLAYLAVHDGLRILNIQDPDQIIPLGTYPTSRRGLGLRVIGQMLCLACDEKTFRILDVSDPTEPELLGSYEASAFISGLEANPTHAFLITRGLSRTVEIVSFENPATPTLTATIQPGPSALEVDVTGNIACVAYGDAGLQVLDLANPAHPVSLAAYTGSGAVQTVACAGTLAGIGTWGGMQLVDLNNPANPVPRGTLMLMMAPPAHIRFQGDRAYIMTSGGLASELVAVSLTNPDNPAQLGTFSPGGDVFDIAITGPGYAALALGPSGVEVVDARDPAAMHRAVLQPSISPVYGVDLQPQPDGFRAFLATTDGLEIIDFRPPTSPTAVGVWTLAGANAHRVRAAGPHVYLASPTQIWVLDITIPAIPKLLATAAGPAANLALLGDQLCTASGSEGLVFWDFQTDDAPPTLNCQASQTGLLLEWNSAGIGWTLQRSTNLGDPEAWSTIPGSADLTTLDVPTTGPTPASMMFYRLTKP